MENKTVGSFIAIEDLKYLFKKWGKISWITFQANFYNRHPRLWILWDRRGQPNRPSMKSMTSDSWKTKDSLSLPGVPDIVSSVIFIPWHMSSPHLPEHTHGIRREEGDIFPIHLPKVPGTIPPNQLSAWACHTLTFVINPKRRNKKLLNWMELNIFLFSECLHSLPILLFLLFICWFFHLQQPLTTK